MSNLTILFSEDELSDDDKELIRTSLNLPAGTDMVPVLTGIFKGASLEYLKMFKNGGMPSKLNELMQDRLFTLISHYFNMIPDENTVSTVFQITTAQSKTLLRNMESRYRPRLAAIKKARLLQILETAEENEGFYSFDCTSKLIIEDLNNIVRLKGPTNSLVIHEKIRKDILSFQRIYQNRSPHKMRCFEII